MNYKLILLLSLFGLAMSVATVFWIPSNLEPVLWLLIFILCAYIIALKCSEKYFLNGFLVSIFNCVWIIAGHIIFYQTYLANHQQEAEMMSKMPILEHSPRLMMLITGPVIGIISGLILGLFAFIGSKIIDKKLA
jgi:amino acid permease